MSDDNPVINPVISYFIDLDAIDSYEDKVFVSMQLSSLIFVLRFECH
ncbi:hypothetical protein J2Y45_006096 [Dyadobacter sp. BE34]|uniref:Uncharacterized protein n=1 Tax=Dyadobacter fermentans TaxID=94254 RepID=A0ABU1R648_9BACT|nr:hypothetical protein [Dyadobacter fermentans]MDR7046625.1 hypothetical protein [Dyadobacter sp. BE242]MDR7200939.1 hypothetical protein [Dyadobacter sp. BE34]MDR7218899.1 hypothetical protein [Dyadobacter sp. BE31]MDR7264891.1 hypothetical protein [Dyadobacter sp. BE32]